MTDTTQPISDGSVRAATDVLGRRCAAAVIDVLVLGVVFVALGDRETSGGSAQVELSGGPFLLWLAIAFLYYAISELIAGRTPGKALLGLRVVKVDGTPAGMGAVAVRTLLRAVDVLPAMYLVGLIALLATGQRRQRLGDLAAGTTVVAR